MNIRITRLLMTNFKCFREKEMNLDEDIVSVRGRNGAGKTTIADAILFTFFGKNVEGQSDLELFKTRENGKVIPNLDHSVEMTLSATTPESSDSGKEVTLRRSIKEVWVKKRGSEESVFKNNTVEYYVNGESYTKADYDKYIASLIDERVFRAITNPNYFPSLKWQEQRDFLTRMAGDIAPDEIADTDDLKAFVSDLDTTADGDIVAYLKHVKYQIKQVKDKLDKIPVRLEEQNKALPERLDWDKMNTDLADTQEMLKSIDLQIAAINQGNGSAVKRIEIRKAIEKLREKMNDIEDKASEEIRNREKEYRQKVSELSMQFNLELNNQRIMEQTIEADNRLIERCKQSIKECGEELERLRLAWPTRKFSIDERQGFCPTCGQPLPEEQWREKQNELRDNFNKALEQEKQDLRTKAAKTKQIREDAEKELENVTAKLTSDTETLAVIKTKINTIFTEKAKEEKKPLPTLDDFLPCNEEYQAAIREIAALESEMNAVTDSDGNKERLASLTSHRAQYISEITMLQRNLATRQQYDKIIALINGINEEQKNLIKQLSELERQEDIARKFQFRQNQLLEERINKHFKIVQWRLFRTVNNGGDSFEEPYCEAYVDGIPYHAGLNQAMRLNAGLDICEALCRFYCVSAPIVIDNAESNLDIYRTTGQQIRLQVYDSPLQLV